MPRSGMHSTSAGSDIPTSTPLPRPRGLRLHPFPALRYGTAAAGSFADLTSPPYDVLDPAAVLAATARSPHAVVQLTLPQYAAPGNPDPYRQAGALLARWRADGILVADPQPALYVYEQRSQTDGHTQRGLLGAVELSRPEDRVILPHENTMAGPVADRLALTRATGSNLEPVFLLYDGGGPATAAVTAAAGGAAGAPVVSGQADGFEHRLWMLTEPAVLADVAADLAARRAVIADGHHRYATALRYQEEQYAAGRGAGPWDRTLALLVDAAAAGPRVGAIHRVLAGLPLEEAVRRAGTAMTVSPVPPAHTEQAAAALRAAPDPAFVLAAGDKAFLLTPGDRARLREQLDAAIDPSRSPAWRGLEVTVAHSWLIPQVLGLADREDVVGFEHDVPAALAAAGADGTALLLRPTPVEHVLAVAAAGERMPRKSTLFTPKPRSGVALRALDLEVGGRTG